MSPVELLEAPAWATEADALEALDGDDKRLVELIDGKLVEKPTGLRESYLAGWILSCPTDFVLLSGADILDGGTVLPGFALPLPELFGYLDPPSRP